MSGSALTLPGPLFVLLGALLVALASYMLHRWRLLSGLAAALGCLFLSWIIAQQRFAEPLSVTSAVSFPWGNHVLGRTLELGRTFVVLGREMAFTPTSLGVLTFCLAAGGLVFLLSLPADQGWSFYSFGTAVIGLLSIAITAQQYIYALLFLWLAANLAVFVLAGGRPGETMGAMRFLAFTTVAMALLLTLPAFLDPAQVGTSPGGFVLPTVASDTPLRSDALLTASSLMIVGFAILLMMVPFHGQMVAIAAHGSPMVAPFMLSILTPVIIYLFFRLGHTYPLLLEDQFAFDVCRLMGIGAVAIGGISAAGQRRWGSMVGYAVLVDWGAGLIALGQATPSGAEQALSAIAWRLFSLLAVGAGWTVLYRVMGRKDDLSQAAGLFRRRPFSVLLLFGGLLSMAAFPLTPGAAGRWPLIRDLVAGQSPSVWVVLLGSAGVGLSAIASLWACLGAPDKAVVEPRSRVIVDNALALLSIALILYLFFHPSPWLGVARQFMLDLALF